MTIDTCVVHAIHKDLDIIEACPEVVKMEIEQLEPYIEKGDYPFTYSK